MNKVYNNIEKSDISFYYCGFEFYFSSNFNKSRFEKKLYEFVVEEQYKIRNKYHVYISNQKYLAVSLYQKIEKRGFKIIDLDNNIIYNKINEMIFETNLLK